MFLAHSHALLPTIQNQGELLMEINEKLENFFIELGIPIEKKESNLWLISNSSKGLRNMIVSVDGPVVSLTLNLMTIPAGNNEKLFKTLLSLNATDLIHGAYGIEGENIVWTDSLLVDTLDLEELQASLDSISLALSQHYNIISGHVKK